MDQDRQRREVDANYDAFEQMLPTLLVEHRDCYALMRAQQIVQIVDKPGDAHDVGRALYADGIFSIQEITDEPVELGYYSLWLD